MKDFNWAILPNVRSVLQNIWYRIKFLSGSSCPQEQQFILPCCQNTFSKVSKLDFNDCMFSLTPKTSQLYLEILKDWLTIQLLKWDLLFLTLKNEFVSHTQRLENGKKKLSNIKPFISMPNLTQKIYLYNVFYFPYFC